MPDNPNRRRVIKNLLATTLASGTAALLPAFASSNIKNATMTLKGNINHAVCRWCFGSLSIEALCVAIKKIGFNAIDLVGPSDWPILQQHGIYSSMCNGAEINLVNGFADKKYHATLISNYTKMIPLVAEAGYTNLICFSGNRNGMDDDTGWNNCVEGLQKIIPLAEKHGVVLHMELLNSKVDHKDYMCDHTAWGVTLCNRLASKNFKLLYDIYHMQIDEGNVISTIQQNRAYIGHYHTAGVPGRHELDATQELNYPAIMKAIVATGFKGQVAQEFIPTAKDIQGQLQALEEAVKICDV